MGNKRIILFFLTGILMCLVILFVGRDNRRFLMIPDQDVPLLIKNVFDDVKTVVIERGGRRIEVQRDGLRWRMRAPLEAGVDQAVMARLLNGFDSVMIKDRLGINEIRGRGLSIADYGLYPAVAKISFRTDEKDFFFLFGSTTAAGEDVYVRKNNLDQILVVPRDVYDSIPADVDELRSHRLVDCDPALVNSIDIRRPGHPFIRLVMQSGVWGIEEPVKLKASSEKVGEFLDRLFDVRVYRFVWPSLDNVMDIADYEKALKMRKGLYGLDDDVGTSIQIYTMDGSFDSKVVIGHKLEKIGEPVYALLDHGMAIGAISNNFADVVNVDPGFFRSMKIFDELTAPLKRIRFIYGKDLFVLSRTNDVWSIDSPASEPADQEAVQKSVDELLSLKADRIETRLQQDESYIEGIDSIHVEFSAGPLAVMASVKKTDYEGKNYEISFAGQSEVCHVAASNMPPVLTDRDVLLNFRDKTLLSLPDGAISRIAIKKSGEPAFGIEYLTEDQSWHIATADLDKGPLNLEVLNRVLDLLKSFRADKVVKIGLSVDDPVYYGFSQPWLEINLDVNIADAVRRTLLIGRSAGQGMRYVMVRGDQSVFLINEKRLAIFAEALTLNVE